jgi:hypothetical protein
MYTTSACGDARRCWEHTFVWIGSNASAGTLALPPPRVSTTSLDHLDGGNIQLRRVAIRTRAADAANIEKALEKCGKKLQCRPSNVEVSGEDMDGWVSPAESVGPWVLFTMVLGGGRRLVTIVYVTQRTCEFLPVTS